MSTFITRSCLLALIATSWSGITNAHLIMKTPVPFGVDSLNNSPLVDAAIGSTGSDFPCKQRPDVYKISQMNNMAVGESQLLSFTGSASHGGGTCQLAVSLDAEPKVNSTWKLIQVYEGGCPVTAAGNDGTDDFTFKIPENFPNGVATLAWVWYNRIGQREIYMNCAPITVTGGSDNLDYYNTLPNMYLINVPRAECASVENYNQAIPFPGQFVVKGDSADKVVDAVGPACAAAASAQTQGVSGYQSAISSNGAGLATSAGGAASTAAAATSTAAANNGMYTQPSTAPQMSTIAVATSLSVPSGFITSVSSLSMTDPAVSSSAVSQPSLDATTQSPASSTSVAVQTPSTPGSTATGSATCSVNGAIVCNGPTQFGLCNFGQVVWQAVAAGTTCSNGSIQKRDTSAISVDRRRLLSRWYA